MFFYEHYTDTGRVPPEQMIKRTDDDMRREFGYIAAGQITQKLLDKGLITPGEFDKIMAKNREKILAGNRKDYALNDLLFRAFRVIYTIPL